MRMVGRLTGLLAAVLIVTGGLVAPAQPAAAATRTQKVTLAVDRALLVSGETLTLTGKATPAGRRTVHLQQRYAGSQVWRTVKKVTTAASGRFSASLTLTSTRSSYFRAYLPRRPGYRWAYSGRSARVRVSASPSADAGGDPDQVTPPVGQPPLVAEPGSPDERQAVSLGIENIVNPQDWDALRSRLDAAHVNVLHLAAGRVEWTAFDWPAHPEVAAEPGTDHLARAIAELAAMPDGGRRGIDLMVDAFIPEWIKHEPSIAGRDADGGRAEYTASAAALHDGPVGDRLVEFATELAVRYKPMQITFTELAFDDETFGADDLALYRRMTGRPDWPREASGRIDESAPEIGAWRSRVLADLLARVRAALDDAAAQVGHRVQLAQDVRVNWQDPAAGRPDAGHDYQLLWQVVDRVVLWVYFDSGDRRPGEVAGLASALAAAAPPNSLTLSVGLWGSGDSGGDSPPVITPTVMADALRAARAAGLSSVNVTPLRLMTPEHWRALGEVWPQAPR